MEPEVEMDFLLIWGETQGRNGRDLFITSGALVEDRGFSSRGPGATYQRSHQETAFVNKHQIRIQAEGFFLMRGHCFLSQVFIAFSFRSRARLSGFCGLQPSEPRSRPI